MRDYMTAYRESLGLTVREMAMQLDISQTLLSMLEGDAECVTHPAIARRIAKLYLLTEEQYTGMIPLNHRPGPDYNPDLYKEDPGEEFKAFKILPTDRRGFYNYDA